MKWLIVAGAVYFCTYGHDFFWSEARRGLGALRTYDLNKRKHGRAKYDTAILGIVQDASANVVSLRL